MEEKWKKISTAPKDGTRVILFRTGYQENMCIGWWNSGTKEWIPVQGILFNDVTHWKNKPDNP